MKRLVIVESPYAGTGSWWLPRLWSRWRNIRYARAAVRDCVLRGEAPIASHLLLTQPGILNDDDPLERKLGIGLGHEWMRACDAVVFYVDRDFSRGMNYGKSAAKLAGKPIEYRRLADRLFLASGPTPR